MKKVILVLLVVILTSCTSNDSIVPEYSILGEWRIVKMDKVDVDDCLGKSRATFFKDGTVAVEGYSYYQNKCGKHPLAREVWYHREDNVFSYLSNTGIVDLVMINEKTFESRTSTGSTQLWVKN